MIETSYAPEITALAMMLLCFLAASSERMYQSDLLEWNDGICAESGLPWVQVDSIQGFAVYSDCQGHAFWPCDALQGQLLKLRSKRRDAIRREKYGY